MPTVDLAQPAVPGAFCGGIADKPCPSGSFCDYASGSHCGGDDTGGACAPFPNVCPTDDHPVCGCDGNPYTNPCFAHAHSVAVATNGPCITNG